MKKISFDKALNQALREEMRANERIVLFGEDVGYAGGVRGVTKELITEFGPDRVRDTPISEAVIVGAGVGAAITGLRPVVEIMYSDFLLAAGDEVMNKMAKWRYMHGGSMKVPMVLRTSCGGGFGGAAEHSQSMEATFMHFPGLQIAYPSTPYDAKGLMKSALRDDNPTIFMEHRLLYKTRGEVPEEPYTIPLGQADIKREGTDVTVVTLGYVTLAALEAARTLEAEGISVEVIDLRTLVPLDRDTIRASLEKTCRLVVVEEGHRTGGFGAELVAEAVEHMLTRLKGARRVAAKDVPIPYAPPMERFVLPDAQDVVDAVHEVMGK